MLWTEWNGKYRDSVRQFWKGEGTSVSELATRLSGSNDRYAHSGRQPYASINFITAHDGFTLNDLVSYNEKHNKKNGEEDRDGEHHNMSATALVLLNGHTDNVPFTLPVVEGNQPWHRVVDTFDPLSADGMYKAGVRYALRGRSVAVFKILAPLRERRRVSDVEQTAALEPAAVEG